MFPTSKEWHRSQYRPTIFGRLNALSSTTEARWHLWPPWRTVPAASSWGQNPVSDKVVAVGDTIDGVLVDAIDFFRGLNDRGQIVFIAFMHDGTERLYRADPRR
jgi:hypothetical protein